MNKKKYKDTFSQIHPSEETVERILDMTENKHKSVCKTALLAIAVIISLLVIGGVVAGAKSDNGFLNSVKDLIETEKTASAKVLEDKSYTNQKGETVREVEVVLDDGTKTGFKSVSKGEAIEGSEVYYMCCAGENGYQTVGVDEDGNIIFGEFKNDADVTVEKINVDLKKTIEE
ncbi:MAG: hypothetical protein IJ447_06295 [Clostridia bacterium]|nr:hypothetical protein [Clostridia bacterium]